jgi:hypothetical protein
LFEKSHGFLIESAPMPEDNDELSAEIDELKERLDEIESDVGTGSVAGLIGMQASWTAFFTAC